MNDETYAPLAPENIGLQQQKRLPVQGIATENDNRRDSPDRSGTPVFVLARDREKKCEMIGSISIRNVRWLLSRESYGAL